MAKMMKMKTAKKAAKKSAPKKAKKSKSMKKRPMNAFFKALIAAKKVNAKDFKYNGKTYVQKKLKTGMIVYKGK